MVSASKKITSVTVSLRVRAIATPPRCQFQRTTTYFSGHASTNSSPLAVSDVGLSIGSALMVTSLGDRRRVGKGLMRWRSAVNQHSRLES